MTQNKSGAILFKGRTPNFFEKAILTTTLISGGVILGTTNPAEAVTVDCGPAEALATVTNANVTYTGAAPRDGQGCEFTYQGLLSGPVGNQPSWSTDLDLIPNLVGNPNGGKFTYTLTAPPGEGWLTAALSANLVAGTSGTLVTKSLCDSSFENCLDIMSVTNAGSQPFAVLPAAYYGANILYVKDTFSQTTGRIDNISNTFQTPGPLPILGAGAAFGFSRKLRGRIKTARLG